MTLSWWTLWTGSESSQLSLDSIHQDICDPSTSQILWMPLIMSHVLAFDKLLMISGLKTPKFKTSPPAVFARSWTPVRPTISRAIRLLNFAHLFSSCFWQFAAEADFKLCPKVQGPNTGKTKLKLTHYDSSESTSIFSASGRFASWENRAAFECRGKENQYDSERLAKERVRNREWGRVKEEEMFLKTIIWTLFNIFGKTQIKKGIRFWIELLRIHFFSH